MLISATTILFRLDSFLRIVYRLSNGCIRLRTACSAALNRWECPLLPCRFSVRLLPSGSASGFPVRLFPCRFAIEFLLCQYVDNSLIVVTEINRASWGLDKRLATAFESGGVILVVEVACRKIVAARGDLSLAHLRLSSRSLMFIELLKQIVSFA